ncbi:hypothetical protein [Cecembia sp.]|uniref:hypothetical protein n=1 Tax=Cecembia sp. TaxID=1898110 RepID=UPI0025C14954|nr:hypothetical protein [Cecembia sp.]
MKAEKHWDESESIQLIRSMIEASKYQVADEKFLYLLWGYGVVVAGLSHYYLQFLTGYEYPYLVWLLMPILGVIHFFYLNKKTQSVQSNTWIYRVLSGIWVGMLFAILAVVAGGFGIGWGKVYPVFMLLYGTSAFATGTALEFKWLMLGGLLSIILGAIAFFFVFQFQLLLLVLAVLVSFVLPAHMMRKN